MQEKSVITRTIEVAPGVYAPGHLGELTQVIDFPLVDGVLEETGTTQRRLRLLPSRVVVYFVLALALFEHGSYRAVWDKLTASLTALPLVRPALSSLSRARRRVGAAPLRRLFETVAGPVATPAMPGAFYRGLRTVAIDGTHLHVPDEKALTWRYPKRAGEKLEFGYPLLRLLAVVECGTRAVLGAVFGPDSGGEVVYAGRLLSVLEHSMLLLADAGFDAAGFLAEVRATGAQFLVRSSARRCPLIGERLPDGSYLTTIGYGVLDVPLIVRVVEAEVTVTLADGTVRTEQWRLLSSLLDHVRYPARELVWLYHERWVAETTYFSIKATMLDGRVLRSRTLPGDRAGGLRPADGLPGAHPRRRGRREHPARPGYGPHQLHRRVGDRRPHGDQRHGNRPRRPGGSPRRHRPGRAAGPATGLAPAPGQGPEPQESHQQVRPERRPAPRSGPDLHLPRRRHDLREGGCRPPATLNATVLQSDPARDHPARPVGVGEVPADLIVWRGR
ncbi:IS4 family transposase [Nonomuraea sp. 10N515B]|uniref:IS4 family transposase n=1 Tax=Nonomuraea sp. 10N515B TaxID=3457422 RepID=UPI003FCDD554